MKAFLKQIRNIKTEYDFIDTVIAVSQACSAYKISWDDFMKLREILKQVRIEKGFKWGARI